MGIVWDKNNTAHIARHGITPELVKKIIETGMIIRTKTSYRYIVEATIGNKHYRLVCDIAVDGNTIYPVTAFPIKKRKVRGGLS